MKKVEIRRNRWKYEGVGKKKVEVSSNRLKEEDIG